MFPVNIPHLTCSTKKYSTRQLLAWWEDCYLFEAMADAHYHATGHYTADQWALLDIARWTRWDVADVLKRRGVSHSELEAMQQVIEEDVNS